MLSITYQQNCVEQQEAYIYSRLWENLISEHVELKRNILWDVIELDWKEVNMTLNGNKINPTASVIILLRDKSNLDTA